MKNISKNIPTRWIVRQQRNLLLFDIGRRHCIDKYLDEIIGTIKKNLLGSKKEIEIYNFQRQLKVITSAWCIAVPVIKGVARRVPGGPPPPNRNVVSGF